MHDKCEFIRVYIYIHDATYTEDFKKIIKYIKKKLIKSTLIICKVNENGKSEYILVNDDKFLLV